MCSWIARTFFLASAIILLLVACREPLAEPLPETTVDEPVATSSLDTIARPTESVHLPLAQAGELSSPTATSIPAQQQVTATPSPRPSPTPTPTATAVPAWLIYDGPALNSEDIGLQIHLHREDLEGIMADLDELGAGWVKTQVSWKLYQPEPNRFDEERFAELDRLVDAAGQNDIKVLLGVAKAPEWSRPTTELDGPPGDNALYQEFMFALASRYQGRVAAYELWNEANLQREWNGMPLSAAALVELMRAGAAGVRAADPEATLISGAPATTGINDGLVAIDDRQYFQQMVAAGAMDVVDAAGAHPYGWANSPDSSSYQGAPETSSHNNHPSFFFADTLSDYRRILDEAGRVETPIWVTEFGWGSYDGLERQPPDGVSYMAEVSEAQQAVYTRRAFAMAQEQNGIGPLILWNLNFGPTFGSEFVESAYSLLRPDGSPRPVFEALAAAPRR